MTALLQCTPTQCKVGRAILGITQKELSERAAVARKTIADFEAGACTLRKRTIMAISNTLITMGVVFIEHDGVRLGQPVKPASNGASP